MRDKTIDFLFGAGFGTVLGFGLASLLYLSIPEESFSSLTEQFGKESGALERTGQANQPAPSSLAVIGTPACTAFPH